MSGSIPAPVLMAPANGTVFHGLTNSIRIRWNAEPTATSYAIVVADYTQPDLRDPRSPGGCAYLCMNNVAATQVDLPVIPGHSYGYFLFAVAGTVVSPAATAAFQVAARPLLPVAPSGLKYFGYWDTSNPRPIDEVLGDQAGYINVTKYSPVPWSLAATTVTLRKAAERGLRVVVHWLYFEAIDVGTPIPAQVAEWAQVVQPYANQILAVSIADEPDCNYNGARFPNGWTPENCQAQRRKIEANIALVKSILPSAAAWVNYTSAWVYGLALAPRFGYAVPSNADWLSFDCYTAWGNCFGNQSVAQMVTTLQNGLSPRQEIVLIPRAFQGDFAGYIPSQDTIAAEAEAHFQMASSNPRIVGIFPFIWWSFDEVGMGPWTGARSSPIVRAKFADIGRRIVNPGLNCRTLLPGQNDTVGLSNGDPRFLCLENQWFDCGWEGNDPAWEIKAQHGQRIGRWTCDSSVGRWNAL
ncbi:MAG: hypothetical protein ACKVPX_04690 [Myxococcaceae bacterium]